MGFGIGSALGAISGGSNLFSLGADMVSAWQSGKQAREMQARQTNWERERATSAHQWEVEDLKKAGLNPILSAGGSGAQTGGISAPTIDTSGYSKIGDHINDAITRAIDKKRQLKEAEAIDADIQQKGFQNSLMGQQAITEAYKRGLIEKQTATEATKAQLMHQQEMQLRQLIYQQANKYQLEMAELEQKIEIAKAEKRYKEAEALEKEYNNRHISLTYWNNQFNILTKSFQNITTGTASLIGAINPGDFIGKVLKNLSNKPSKYPQQSTKSDMPSL